VDSVRALRVPHANEDVYAPAPPNPCWFTLRAAQLGTKSGWRVGHWQTQRIAAGSLTRFANAMPSAALAGAAAPDNVAPRPA